MAISITTIQPQDSLAGSRLVINSNFSALKTGIDNVQSLLDPSTYTLSGVKSASIADSAVPLSSSILSVSKGASILGNTIFGTVGASTSVLINGNGGVTISESSLTLTAGSLTLSDSTSTASFGGNVSVTKEFRLAGLASAFSSPVSMTASATVTTSTRKWLVISNSSTSTGLTATLSAGNSGQVLEIFHSLGASGYPVYISASNFSGLTGAITLTKTGDTLKCVYDGSSWYLFNYSPASFGLTSGPTASSIRFTTV